jgi:hypothetical protein
MLATSLKTYAAIDSGGLFICKTEDYAPLEDTLCLSRTMLSVLEYPSTLQAMYRQPLFSSTRKRQESQVASHLVSLPSSRRPVYADNVVAIYSRKDTPEHEFTNDVQSILHALHDIEATMPAEYTMQFEPSRLLVAGQPFASAPLISARTSSGLYISVFSVCTPALQIAAKF